MKNARALVTFHTVHTEGGLLPLDLLQRIVLEDKTLPGLSDEAYHLLGGDRLRDAINRSWSQLTTVWKNFKAALDKLPETDRAMVVTRDRWLLPLFKALDFGHLPKSAEEVIDGKTYAITHRYNKSPIHLIGCRVKLDDPQKEKGGRAVTAHGLTQDYLNRSDGHLWGFVSNGFTLRILRDHHSLTQQAYVEFDLQAMMEGEHFGEFCLLWLLCHQSRVDAEKPEECWLEKWFQQARDEGVRALDKLRDGVEKAIMALGTGFLKHKANKKLQRELEEGTLDKQEFYRLLLRLVYRLIFLFVAEDRDALNDPRAPSEAHERYRRWYSTQRIRELADKRRGGPHGDLWQGLLLVMRKLATGSSELALPALGSFLWRSNGIGLLGECELSNEHLLGALRELCYVEHGKTRYAVSWRNIGAEELGSVYESLLERHPKLERESGHFELDTAAGHERKTTGSYYTPKSLVECLLDSALEPVLDEAARKGEQAILDLKVCDPACGSGHFLVAAARRIATRLASVRTGGDEPSPKDVGRALRDVVGRCIYGVDLNPMAVELCKVSLWMEAIEPGKPLSFLEAHIRQGNALLGTTPKLMDGGIPDEAFEVIEGDDKDVAKRLKKRNKEERKGQTTLFSDFAKAAPMSYGRLSTGVAVVEADADGDITAVEKKEADWDRFTESKEYTDAWFLADAWCAAFVWPKEKGPLEDGAITSDLWQRMKVDVAVAPKVTRKKVQELSQAYSFFHWHLAFPQVFLAGKNVPNKDDATGWAGGFDVVLGNPPWDAMSPDAKEFFSQYDPSVRFLDPTAQATKIATLTADPAIASSWEKYRKDLYFEVHFLKESGRYRLYAPGNLGKGDFNIYRMFVETALTTVCAHGMVAQIVPEGLYNGANAMAIRKELMTRFDWRLVLGFQNLERRWFPAIYYRMRFCLYAAQRGGKTTDLRAAFGILSDQDLARAIRNPLVLPCSIIAEFSPDALAIMELQSQKEINIATKMYARCSKFGDMTTTGHHRQYMRELDMGNDRDLFTENRNGIPLYEGRMVYLYDHRAKGYRSGRGKASEWADLQFSDPTKSIQPQWHVNRDQIPEKVVTRSQCYRIGFCDVASPTNERTLVMTLIPPAVLCGHKVPTIMYQEGLSWAYLLTIAAGNSFTMDFLARKKVSLSMTYTILDSLPFPRLAVDSNVLSRIAPVVLRLLCTGPEMTGYWNEMAKHGWVTAVDENAVPPGLIDEEQRLAAVCEIEAIVAHDLYGLTRDELAYIMDTFPIVEKRDKQKYGTYKTKDLVLEAYDRLKGS